MTRQEPMEASEASRRFGFDPTETFPHLDCWFVEDDLLHVVLPCLDSMDEAERVLVAEDMRRTNPVGIVNYCSAHVTEDGVDYTFRALKREPSLYGVMQPLPKRRGFLDWLLGL